MSTNRVLPSLTPLRGLAAVLVVLYHYNLWASNLALDDTVGSIGNGYLAVDLFFMISGFVMAHVYQRAFASNFRGNYLNFLGARVARLYPLHILILLLFLATALSARTAAYLAGGGFAPIPLQGPRSIAALVANLFMLQGLNASALSWNYPEWSISVEFVAYLLFPLALPSIRQAPVAAKIALAAGLFAALGYLAQSTGDDFNQWDGLTTLIRCLPEFFLGTLLYMASETPLFGRLLRGDAVALLLLAAVGVLLETGISDYATVVAFAALLPTAVLNQGFVTRALNAKPLVWLGEISYSLYLMHGFVQFVTARLLDAAGVSDLDDVSRGASFALVAAMLAAAFVLAAISYATVERVGRLRLQRYFGLAKANALPARSGAAGRSAEA